MGAKVVDQADALRRLFLSPISGAELRSSAEAVIQCCEALYEAGEAERLLDLADAAEKTLGELDAPILLRFELQRLRALFILNRDFECHERSIRTLARFEGSKETCESDYLRIRLVHGSTLWRLNRVDEALSRLGEIRIELLRKPDSVLHAICAVNISSAFIVRGDWESAKDYALEALVSARRAASDLWTGIACLNLCIAERGRCRWSSSVDAGEQAIKILEGISNVYQLHHVQRSLSVSLWKTGRLEEALRLVDKGLVEAAQREHTVHVWYSELLKALVLLHLGEFDRVAETLSNDFLGVGAMSESRPSMLRLEYIGDMYLERNDASTALGHYDSVLPKALALIPRGDIVAELRRRRAECHLLIGDFQESFDEASEAISLCRELGDRYEEAATYRVIGLAAAALGRLDDAKRLFDQGFQMYDDIETPYEWGKLWMSYGDWLGGPHAGHFTSLFEAKEAYDTAIHHFERIGAQFKLGQARERASQIALRIVEEGAQEDASIRSLPRRRPRIDRALHRRIQWAFDTYGIVTRHAPLLDMLEQVKRIAVADIPVLVLGESGTGKELVAQGIHELSGRTGKFAPVNCGSVPANLMESEFFGHVQGAYTGAMRDRTGYFEDCHLGSIFLDEIGEMPVDMQSKLLRFLESGQIRRVGETSDRHVNVRLVAATNRERAKMESGDGFRSDLYYRLAHAVFTLPPLRERGADDIDALVDHFLAEFNEKHRKEVRLAATTRDQLLAFPWPGNVRQVRAVMQMLVVQSPDEHVVTPRELPLERAAGGPMSFSEEIVDQEKRRILVALEKTHYVKADAARMLRMSRTTLLGKMKRYGITG